MDQTSRLLLSKIQADALVPVSDLRQAITDNANKLDTAALIIHGAAADRPPAGVVDRFYWAQDTGVLSHDDGIDWWPIASDPAPSTLVDTFANRPSPATLTDGTRFVAADSGMESVAYNGAWVPVGHRIGDTFTTGRTGDSPGGDLLLADGRLIDRTTYAAFFAAVGHAYNGGVDPGSNKVRLPDKRGRVSVGADNMGTAQGAASRIPNSNRALGQSGGEERHILSVSELAAHTHSYRALDTSGTPSPSGVATSGIGSPPAGVTGSAGGNAAHNNMAPYECDNVLVRVA